MFNELIGNIAAKWDESHVWGKFKEVQLDHVTILREIYVYPGGRTSIHRHEHSCELNFIVGGAVRVFTGEDPYELSQVVLRQGQAYSIRAGLYHAVQFENAEHTDQDPYAHFYEVVYNFRTPDDIERSQSAIAGLRNV